MSYVNFKEAMELAKKCDFYGAGKGVSDETIKKAEEELGIVFSRELYEYLREYSYIVFFGYDFYGIIEVDSSGMCQGSMVETAISDRKNYGLPLKWIPILFLDDGYTAYLDYDNLNSEGEPRVIEGIYMGDKFEMTAVLAEDFGDYILQLAEEVLPWKEITSLEAQEQVEQVLEESIKMAKEHLIGITNLYPPIIGFYPFAMGMLENGEISLIDMQENRKDVVLDIIKGIKENRDKYRVVSIVTLVDKDDIKILVEHREGVAIDEIIPYEIKGFFKKYVELGEKSVYRNDKFIWNEEEKVEE
ncbi:MAG: SMI1/KNR4 family protein [Clostridia bacterium]